MSEEFDGSDIHLHSADAKTMTKMISKVKGCTTSPLITTEWSQEPAVTSSGWLGEPCVLNTSLTNLECLSVSALRPKQWHGDSPHRTRPMKTSNRTTTTLS